MFKEMWNDSFGSSLVENAHDSSISEIDNSHTHFSVKVSSWLYVPDGDAEMPSS